MAYMDVRAYSNTGYGTALSIQQTADGGYIVAGNSNSLYYLDSYHHSFVLKLDIDGALLWQRSFGDACDTINAIRQTSDGGYIMMGTGFVSFAGEGVVSRLDADGSVSWQKSGGRLGIELTQDGDYIAVSEYSMFKLDANGDVLWLQSLGNYNYSVSVVQTLDGRYTALVSYSTSSNQSYDVLAKTFDGDGNECPNLSPSSYTTTDVDVAPGDSLFEETTTNVNATSTSIIPIDTSVGTITLCHSPSGG